MAMTTEIRIHIRWMIRRDMSEVLEIENESFEYPWSEEIFVKILRQRGCIGMIAEHEESVIGYMIYKLQKPRLELLNFAVAKRFRRQGVGRAMVEKLFSKLGLEDHPTRKRILAEVQDSNLDAQLFFKALGFRAILVLKDHYPDAPGDAYLMQYIKEPKK